MFPKYMIGFLSDSCRRTSGDRAGVGFVGSVGGGGATAASALVDMSCEGNVDSTGRAGSVAMSSEVEPCISTSRAMDGAGSSGSVE